MNLIPWLHQRREQVKKEIATLGDDDYQLQGKLFKELRDIRTLEKEIKQNDKERIF